MTARTFSLKDDTCLSGIRANPDDCQRGGGYLDPHGPVQREPSIICGSFAEGELAMMVVGHSTPPHKQGRSARGLDINVTRAEREAVAEWVRRSAKASRAKPNSPTLHP